MAIQKATQNFYQLTGHYLSNSTEVNLFPIMVDFSSNEYFLNIFRVYTINEAVQNSVLFYVTHEVDSTDWLDTISMKYYGIPNLWWVIALVNGFNNPFEDLEPGTNLKI